MKFFVSYSRSVQKEVGAVIKLLRAAGYEVWWDGDIPTMSDWWATILNEIEACEVFIFMISEKSVVSPYCMEELRYAIGRNRPVLPFILDDHTKYNLPDELGRGQRYKHDGDPANMLARILGDCQRIDWSLHEDLYAARPPEPNSGSGSVIKQFQQAVTLAQAGQFEQALTRFRNVKSLDPKKWGKQCEHWILRVTVYSEVAELADHSATLQMARQQWSDHLQSDSDVGDFDPLLVLSKIMGTSPPPPLVITIISPPPPPPAIPLLEWIDIPAGEFTMGSDKSRDKAAFDDETPQHTETTAAYKIGKYPVTYGQYELFVAHAGYSERLFWTDEGWKWKEDKTEPLYWNDPDWHKANHPVIGVTWYESFAFCSWLTAYLYPDVWAEYLRYRATRALHTMPGLIRLPTEAEWEKAARWDAKRKVALIYPYGDSYDPKRANTTDSKIGHTTSVTSYPNGVSPYGVFDMSGNVWNWCLTKWRGNYKTKADEDPSGTSNRVVRGGSWYSNMQLTRAAYRDSWNPSDGSNYRGFRLCALS
jgi:formylglycine-generating enzyme required for sulfatase activity